MKEIDRGRKRDGQTDSETNRRLSSQNIPDRKTIK